MNCFNVSNMSGFIKYLVDPQEEDSKLKKFTLTFILGNFFKIHEDENGNGNMQQISEDFLLKNIGIDIRSPLLVSWLVNVTPLKIFSNLT